MADFIQFSVGGGDDFTPAPTGMQQAVCVDGIDLGEKVEQYMGEQPKIVRKYALVFQTAELNEQGKPFEVSIEFTASLGPKATMRKFIGDWRGKALTDDEARLFDVTKLVGANTLLNIEHKVSAKGRTYAKIKNATPLLKGMPSIKANGYERAPYWNLRKDDYMADVIKFRQQNAGAMYGSPAHAARQAPAPVPAPDEDLVGALTAAQQAEEIDLPF